MATLSVQLNYSSWEDRAILAQGFGAAEMYKRHINNATKFPIKSQKTLCLGSKQTKCIYAFSTYTFKCWFLQHLFYLRSRKPRNYDKAPRDCLQAESSSFLFDVSSISKLLGSLNPKPEGRLRTESTAALTAMSPSPSTVPFTFPHPSPFVPLTIISQFPLSGKKEEWVNIYQYQVCKVDLLTQISGYFVGSCYSQNLCF